VQACGLLRRDDGNLYALDAATGSKLWFFSTGSAIQNSPAAADGRIYIGSDNGNEYAFALPVARHRVPSLREG
jgi:outer membrane protein assembly factor BamB